MTDADDGGGADVDLLTSVTRVILPVAVGLIMFCLGLGLSAGDFAALIRRPRFLAVGETLVHSWLTTVSSHTGNAV